MISFDRLHAYHSGLFGTHLFGEFKDIAKDLGKKFITKIDTQLVLYF